MDTADPADHPMVPNTDDMLKRLPEDPLNGQLSVGDVVMLVFAVLASVFAMIITLAT